MPIMVNNQGAGGDYEKVHFKAGVYKAQLATLKVEDKPSVDNPEVKVPTLIWGFKVKVGGDVKVVEHWSGATASLSNEKSWSRRFWMALCDGEPPTEEGQSDLEELIGLICFVRVADHTTKKNEKISKIKDAWPLSQGASSEPGESF